MQILISHKKIFDKDLKLLIKFFLLLYNQINKKKRVCN